MWGSEGYGNDRDCDGGDGADGESAEDEGRKADRADSDRDGSGDSGLRIGMVQGEGGEI